MQKNTSKLLDFIISEIFAAWRSKRPCFIWKASWSLWPPWSIDAGDDGSVGLKNKPLKNNYICGERK